MLLVWTGLKSEAIVTWENRAPVLPAENRAVGFVNERHVLIGQNESIFSVQVAQVGRRRVVHLHIEADRCIYTSTTMPFTVLCYCLRRERKGPAIHSR